MTRYDRRSTDDDPWASARQRMLRVDLQGRGITDVAVLQVMAEMPRECFVPAECRGQAYDDHPVPIGLDQTVSQPYIVALMTQALMVAGDCDVLEIGTGSGYQTAVLAALARKIYTIERHADLSGRAEALLKTLGIVNCEFLVGDGSLGWPSKRTFDRIMVTAAVPQVPQPVLDQLNIGGLLIAPVGGASYQRLVVLHRTAGGPVLTDLSDVRFVRLIGECGFHE